MAGYWIIAPVEASDPEKFDRVWQFDLIEGFISIGWTQLGDVSHMTREQIVEAVAEKYPEKPAQTKSLYANIVWKFYHAILPGDIIVARRGRKALAAVGEVKGPAFYSPNKNPALSHPNFLPVSWREQPRDLRFPSVVFPMHTLAPVSQEKFQKLIEGEVIDPPSDAPETVADPNVFVLEKYLEEFIVSNFQTIFNGTKAIYIDGDGNNGQQYSTDVGPIDILATETGDKSFIVIELKKGRPSDQVVGQVLRYMGWVKENLCKEGQQVRGLVICREADPKLSYALKMTTNIDVQYYEVDFRLKDAPK